MDSCFTPQYDIFGSLSHHHKTDVAPDTGGRWLTAKG